MKRVLLLICLIFLVSSAYAESNKVYIVGFNYADGVLMFEDKLVKHGFSPDRKLVTGDYRGEIVSFDGDILYNFDFDVPLTNFVDMGDVETGKISGGIVKLDNTKFALVLPYYEEAQDIVVYDSKDTKVLSVDVEEKEDFDYLPWIIGLVVLLVFLIVFLLIKNKKK